jgi:putative membrane protein
MAIGILVLIVSWVLLACVAIVLEMQARSPLIGAIGALAIGSGLALFVRGIFAEWRSYRALRMVDVSRHLLNDSNQPIEATRAAACVWVQKVSARIPDSAVIEQGIRGATTAQEIVYLLRNRVADPLRTAAMQVGRRAALETASLIAISPHASWDGLIVAMRSLVVIRRIAELYGFRPGAMATIALIRKVAWTAAGTAGLELLSRGLADQALSSLPIAKYIAGALPGTSLAAMRLYRLARITADACCPVPD